MPFVTLADFIVEQAVTIVIGAVTVAAAPKVAPKLAELGGDLSAKTKARMAALPLAGSAAAVTVSGAEAVRANALAAGQGVSRSVSGGVAWFGQQWGGLLDGAVTDDVAAAVDPASLLAGLSTANLASFAPGRARLRLSQLRGQPRLAEQVVLAAAANAGIGQVQGKSTTGSLVILFDADQYPTPESLLQALAGVNEMAEIDKEHQL